MVVFLGKGSFDCVRLRLTSLRMTEQKGRRFFCAQDCARHAETLAGEGARATQVLGVLRVDRQQQVLRLRSAIALLRSG